MTYYDNPNQQVARADGSGPGYPTSALWTLAAPVVVGRKVTVAVPAGVKADSFEIHWGDGSSQYWGAGETGDASHDYTGDGEYVVLVDPFADKYASYSTHVRVGSGGLSAASFDPGEHTVAEVQAYLADHPDEADAVLAAERAGKARVGLVGEA